MAIIHVEVPLMEEAEELAEAPPLWVVRLGPAQVPLADHPRGVARRPEGVGDGLLRGRQADMGQAVLRPDGVEFVAEPLLVAAGQEPGS